MYLYRENGIKNANINKKLAKNLLKKRNKIYNIRRLKATLLRGTKQDYNFIRVQYEILYHIKLNSTTWLFYVRCEVAKMNVMEHYLPSLAVCPLRIMEYRVKEFTMKFVVYSFF